RLLWCNDVRRPTYFWARRWFLRALGTIYLIAFVSLWVQVNGLVGSDGMSPANQFLPAVRAEIGPDAYTLLPTLCWFGQSDASLYFLCGSGVLFSLLLFFGISPAISLFPLFDLFCAMEIVAKTIFCRGSRAGCEQFSPRRRHACHRTSHSITTTRTAGFPRRFVFAQASSVQTDADVWGGEADQRRSELVEP